MSTMTVVNIYMKEEEKRKLQDFVDTHNVKSVSDFIRKLIDEKLKLESDSRVPEDVEIPEWVPKDKYVVFVNNAIVAVGDTPSEATSLAAKKGAQPPILIKFNGAERKPPEFAFMSLVTFHSWNYSILQGEPYPLLQITIDRGDGEELLFATIDTAASLCVLKEGQIPMENFRETRVEQIYSTGGVLNSAIYEGTIKILGTAFDIEFMLAPIDDQMPFQFLIGRNVLKDLDAFFFGKKQMFWLRQAEP